MEHAWRSALAVTESGEAFGVYQAARHGREWAVERHHIRLGQSLFQWQASVGRRIRRRRATRQRCGDHPHTQRLGDTGDACSHLAHSHDRQRLPVG